MNLTQADLDNLMAEVGKQERRAMEAEARCSSEYVRGWNDGEADAEALRVRAEAAEARVRVLERALQDGRSGSRIKREHDTQ